MSDTEKDDMLQKRVQKVLENRFYNNRETLEALQDLSTFFGENTHQSRRNLRSQIEKRSLVLNENFLDAFTEIKVVVDSVCEDISWMSSKVKSMRDNLKATEDKTHDLISKTHQLQEESAKLTTQHQVASAFLQRFQLTPEEHKRLHSKSEPITPEFFETLERVQKIHSDCRVLLQSGYQTAALDIMEEMTTYQEVGLEKLYRWTQAQCRSLEEVGPLVMQAMSRLQERPILFKYVIDEYATARRSVLVRNFIDALTSGPKPLEMHAHDPKRYIGDVFAWLHQAFPSERDNLLLLVRMCDKLDTTDLVAVALANIADGVCHPLKVRVETILNSGTDTILLYSVANLIRFYQNIINGVVRGGNLEQTLAELRGISEATYLNAISHVVRSEISRFQGQIQRDLVPPPCVGRLLGTLKEILSVASMVEERQEDIKKIMGCVIDPLLQFVTETAAHLTTTDMAVYLLNCLCEMMTALAMFEYMNERMERLQGQCDAQIDTLTSEQASSLVTNLNLGSIYTVLQSNSSKIDVNHLKNFMTKFDQFLEMPDILLLPQIQLLISSTHRSTVQKRSFSVILAIYKQLYERVMDPSNGFVNPESLFDKTPEQVSELLSL